MLHPQPLLSDYPLYNACTNRAGLSKRYFLHSKKPTDKSTHFCVLVCSRSIMRKKSFRCLGFASQSFNWFAVFLFHYIELERIKQALFKSIVVKKYQYQKNQGSIPDDKENILNRDFKADTVFKKLVTDITYIHVVNEGWTYLASVMVLTEHLWSSSMRLMLHQAEFSKGTARCTILTTDRPGPLVRRLNSCIFNKKNRQTAV